MPALTSAELHSAILSHFAREGLAHRDVVFERVHLENPETHPWLIQDAWHDLYRRGVITPGLGIKAREAGERQYNDLNSATHQFGQKAEVHDSPWVHLTEHGKAVVVELSHDPVNRPGYLAAVGKHLSPKTVASSYLEEGLLTFAHGSYTATAVLVGGACEAILLDLRDHLATKIAKTDKAAAEKLRKLWKAKEVADQLTTRFETISPSVKALRTVRERYEAYWSPLVHRTRFFRNEAGHPRKLQPISRDDARMMLVLFPHFAELAVMLAAWIKKHA